MSPRQDHRNNKGTLSILKSHIDSTATSTFCRYAPEKFTELLPLLQWWSCERIQHCWLMSAPVTFTFWYQFQGNIFCPYQHGARDQRLIGSHIASHKTINFTDSTISIYLKYSTLQAGAKYQIQKRKGENHSPKQSITVTVDK